jgi:hypothetical protein
MGSVNLDYFHDNERIKEKKFVTISHTGLIIEKIVPNCVKTYERCSKHNYSHRVHTERQWPISGVYPIMIGKNQPCLVRVGGARPPPFTLSTIT